MTKKNNEVVSSSTTNLEIGELRSLQPKTPILNFGVFEEQYNHEVRLFIREYVEPYIKSLPNIQAEHINEIGVFRNEWIFDRREKYVEVVFSIDGKLVIENALVALDLKSNEKPFITYKYLNRGFDDFDFVYQFFDHSKYKSHTVHHVTLHLPIDYQF